jgi:hypothetical protein
LHFLYFDSHSVPLSQNKAHDLSAQFSQEQTNLKLRKAGLHTLYSRCEPEVFHFALEVIPSSDRNFFPQRSLSVQNLGGHENGKKTEREQKRNLCPIYNSGSVFEEKDGENSGVQGEELLILLSKE